MLLAAMERAWVSSAAAMMTTKLSRRLNLLAHFALVVILRVEGREGRKEVVSGPHLTSSPN
jgi:hypothetical protein